MFTLAADSLSPSSRSDSSAKPLLDLHDAVAEAARAAHELRLAEAEYAYRMAIAARAAAGRRISGTSAVEATAKELGVARRTLQQFAILAARWTIGEYRVLLERRGPRGHSLSPSHLLVIAPLSREAREHWVQRALHEGLAVRKLRGQITKGARAVQRRENGGPSANLR